MVNLEKILNKLFFLFIGVYGFLFAAAFLIDLSMSQYGAADTAHSGDSALAGE
ncbi:MAG: hypothetical protein O7B79_06150 [SAR324 cluster bacterium]|nr:hypothetical protein [SAR324 cluster bacterium]